MPSKALVALEAAAKKRATNVYNTSIVEIKALVSEDIAGEIFDMVIAEVKVAIPGPYDDMILDTIKNKIQAQLKAVGDNIQP